MNLWSCQFYSTLFNFVFLSSIAMTLLLNLNNVLFCIFADISRNDFDSTNVPNTNFHNMHALCNTLDLLVDWRIKCFYCFYLLSCLWPPFYIGYQTFYVNFSLPVHDFGWNRVTMDFSKFMAILNEPKTPKNPSENNFEKIQDDTSITNVRKWRFSHIRIGRNKYGGRGGSKPWQILLKFSLAVQFTWETNWCKEEHDQKNFAKYETPYGTCIVTVKHGLLGQPGALSLHGNSLYVATQLYGSVYTVYVITLTWCHCITLKINALDYNIKLFGK